MSINLDNVTNILLGNTPVEQIADSQGNVLWSSAPAPEYFYVEDISGSNNTLSITKSASGAPTIEVFKSTDGETWESMGNTSTTAITATIPANGKLYLKATANVWGGSIYNGIKCSGSHNVGGNIMSLLYGDNYIGKTAFPTGSSYYFSRLFYQNTTLVSAEDLILSATTLTSQCYEYTFGSCTALTTAPVLPATTLADGCYQFMFNGCTSLTTAPALPATTLANYCYYQMFKGCSNLNSVTTYASNISASNCLQDWLSGVSATGDFYNLGGATYTSGTSGIPTGWTEHTSL